MNKGSLQLAALVLMVVAMTLFGCSPVATPSASQPTAPQAPAATTVAEPTAVAPVASSPTASAASGASTGGKTLRIGTGSDILTLDPAFMVQVPDYPIATAIYNSLVKYKPGLTSEVEPDLAESWEISDDGRTYTFKLREGVMWQKGYGEVTADDVKYSFERIKNPETGSNYASDFASVESIDVIDKYTIAITFKEPNAAFLSAVAAFRPGRIVNQKAIEEFGQEYTSNAVGSGPYMLESRTPGSEIVLVKNPEYWDADSYKIDRIVYKIIPEPSVVALGLQSGDIDVAYISNPDALASLRGVSGINITEEAGSNIVKLYFQTQREPFDKLEVRQAIEHAVDSAAIAEFALNGVGVQAKSEIPEFMFGYTEDVPTYDYDPAKAKEMLSEAGFPDGLDMNIIVWSFGTYPKAAEALPDMLREAGINATLDIVEGGQIQNRFKAGDYDAAVFGIGRLDPDQVLRANYLSTNIPSGNRAWYSNPALDKLLLAQLAATDPEMRKTILAQAQRLIREQAVDVPLYVEKIFVASRDNVSGIQPASLDVYPWKLLDIQ